MRTRVYDVTDSSEPMASDGIDSERDGLRLIVPGDLPPHVVLAQLARLQDSIRAECNAPLAAHSCPACPDGHMEIRHGQYGAFLGCDNYRHGCKHTQSVKPAAHRVLPASESEAEQR